MPPIALLKGSGKPHPSIHIFSDMIFKCPELTGAAVAAQGEDSSKEKWGIHHTLSAGLILLKESHLIWILASNTTLNLNQFLKPGISFCAMDPTPECLQL